MTEICRVTIGFTGNRNGFNQSQAERFERMLRDLKNVKDAYGSNYFVEFHHGCCKGSDLQAADMFRKWFPDSKIVQHPPVVKSWAVINENDVILPSKPFLDRNFEIATRCDFLVAVPKEREEQLRSGTWATVRYARKLNKPVEILYP